jgi:hypothetical protein
MSGRVTEDSTTLRAAPHLSPADVADDGLSDRRHGTMTWRAAASFFRPAANGLSS